MKTRKKIPLNAYLIGVVSALILAALFPEAGARGGVLKTEIFTKVAVVVIFLNQGLVLPTEALKSGLLQWKFHLAAQLFIFLLFPLAAGLALLPFLPALGPDLWLGYLYLAILPTTITTAVVYTGKAGGSSGTALFTTALSNIAGIFIVPMVMISATRQVFGEALQGEYALLPTLVKITGLILVPLLAGQIFRPFLKHWAERHKGPLRNINVWLVYFIVFAAFADSFYQDAWAGFGPVFLLVQGLLCIALLGTMSAAAWGAARLLGLSPENRIAFFFCASQKTLAAGVPMAGSIFIGESPALGLVLLPIMMYHPLQLILGGYLIGRWGDGAR